MSAPVVAVTTLLIDVLDRLGQAASVTPSEKALADLLRQDLDQLQHIKVIAVAEMHALAPAMLAADAVRAVPA